MPVWGYNGSGRSGAKASYEALRDKRLQRDRQFDPFRHRAGRDRGLGADPEGARPLRPRPRACAPRSATPRAAFRWRRASPGTGSAMSASCPPIPAHRNTICSTARRRSEGDVIRFPRLAQTLKTIAAKGAQGFYEGEVAADMAATVAARGSFLTAEDFADHRGDAVDADLDQLSRRRSGRDPAERAGHHRAGDAQHPRELRHQVARPDRAGAFPSRARSRAHRLRRARHASRRCRPHAHACRRRSPTRPGPRSSLRSST